MHTGSGSGSYVARPLPSFPIPLDPSVGLGKWSDRARVFHSTSSLLSPGARRVKQLGRGIRRLYDAYATTHAKKLFPDAAVDLFRDCGVVPAHASADDVREAVGAAPIDYDGFCRAVAELGHVCFCHAIDVEGVGRVWTPAKDDDPLRALFRVISSSKAFYAAQKHTTALW